jgi:hypothetical protein
MVETLINKYRTEIKQGLEMLDQVVDKAMLGASTSPNARRLILLGAGLAGIGAIGLLSGVSILALEMGAGMSVLAGLSSMVSGLVMGYRSLRENSREDLHTQINTNLNKQITYPTNLIKIFRDIFITHNSEYVLETN